MTITRRQVLSGLAGLGVLAAVQASGEETIRLSGRAFGTGWSILLPGGIDERLPGEIVDILDRVDRAMSPFRADSEISAFNCAAAGAFAAGPDLARVCAEALRIAALSDGAFDPTVGPLVGRYGFGPIRGGRVGDYTALSCSSLTLGKADAALSMDLCGIAKGYALDLVAAHLRHAGHRHFLIDIGGELLASGQQTGRNGWLVGISDPLDGGIHTQFAASDLAIATSGDAINAYETAGRRYSHLIDPRSDQPVHTRLASVSVVDRSAMTADGLATALFVLGLDRGPAFAELHGLAALFLLRNSEGGVEAVSSRAFTALVHA
jgi:thiamine biosynthesis lipoprotein